MLSRFITRDVDRLMDGENEFRFVSFNIPCLFVNENPTWQRVDRYEIEDALKSIVQLGGQVIRTYTISIKGDQYFPEGIKHVMAPRLYTEELFEDLDLVLKLCNDYGVRLIIPFINEWPWFGGKDDFAAFRGKDGAEFYTDPLIREDFKHFVSYMINRVNTLTGVMYRDDKAILAWQLGNELISATDEWCADMAFFIKSLDPNHLVADGKWADRGNVHLAQIEDPNIDIVYNNYYNGNIVERCRVDRELARGKKVYIIAEFGLLPTAQLEELLKEALHNGCSGALIWSLRFHNKDGGFYWHLEDQNGYAYKAYHWPGFPSGNDYDETNVLRMMREFAFRIRGLTVPPMDIPEPPVLLPIHDSRSINWRGSAGASQYRIERAVNPEGPWTLVGNEIDDAKEGVVALFEDNDAPRGVRLYYRIYASNIAGESLCSNLVSYSPEL